MKGEEREGIKIGTMLQNKDHNALGLQHGGIGIEYIFFLKVYLKIVLIY